MLELGLEGLRLQVLRDLRFCLAPSSEITGGERLQLGREGGQHRISPAFS